jgi:hypothetical protein
MHATNFYLRRGASVFASLAALALGGVGAQADTAPKQTDAFPLFDNYIKVGGQDTSLTGDGTAFQARTQQPKSGSGGIEDFHYSKDLGKDQTMEFDGRAMAGAEDYLGKLSLSKTDFGSVEMGYKKFRTFYDGVGGFFPGSNTWTPMNPEDLHVDRGQLWVEAKLNLPNLPAFSIRYVNETRNGKKDSTIWGDSDFTGLPNNNPPISQVRKLVPSYLNLDERHQELEGIMKHTIGNTTFQLTLLGDKTDNLDTRFVTRFPGEAKRFPTPAATVLVPAANMNNQIVMSQFDGVDAKTFLAKATVETVFSEKFKVFAGISYQDVKNDFTGDRPLLTSTPTATGVVVAASDNNLNLLGNAKATIYTGNFGVELKPVKELSVNLAARAEDEYTKSAATFTSVTAAVNTTTGVVTTTNTPQVEYSRVKGTSWTPAVDIRFTGIPDLALYASASKRMLNGDERYSTPYNPATAPFGTIAANNLSEDHGNYTVGASLRQSAFLTLRGEVFYKDHVNQSIGYATTVGDRYVLGYQFTGIKLTAIAKPLAVLTFTTRYIYQKGNMDVGGYIPGYGDYDSMKATNYTLAETVDWTPTTQFYMQANANLVLNVIGTVYPRAGIVPGTTTNVTYSADGVLQNSNNNYFTGSLLAGAVLTKTDDLQVQVTYYKADDANTQLANLTLPYGVAAEEVSVSVGVKHKFSDRLIGHAKVGYFDSKNDTTGGNTNFHGPQGYVSLDYAL